MQARNCVENGTNGLVETLEAGTTNRPRQSFWGLNVEGRIQCWLDFYKKNFKRHFEMGGMEDAGWPGDGFEQPMLWAPGLRPTDVLGAMELGHIRILDGAKEIKHMAVDSGHERENKWDGGYVLMTKCGFEADQNWAGRTISEAMSILENAASVTTLGVFEYLLQAIFSFYLEGEGLDQLPMKVTSDTICTGSRYSVGCVPIAVPSFHRRAVQFEFARKGNRGSDGQEEKHLARIGPREVRLVRGLKLFPTG